MRFDEGGARSLPSAMVSNASRLRLSFALGSWQIVALAAALAQADAEAETDAAAAQPAAGAGTGVVADVLVLYETGPASAALVTAMRDTATAVRPWRAVVEAFAAMASIDRRMSQVAFNAAQANLRALVGAEQVDEIWLCRATRAAERLVIDTWPDATVMLYEDGVLSYLPAPPVAAATGIASWLDGVVGAGTPARRLRRWKHAYDPRQFARVGGAWMLLGDAFAPPQPLGSVPWHPVGAGHLRAAIDACGSIPSVASFRPPPTTRPAVLVLGQALSRFHAVSREAELRIYADAVKTVVERGYDVWWKEHPRAMTPFFAEIAMRVPAIHVRELALPFALPVELVADRLGLVACVGGITTALFYLPRLLGIPAYTVAAAFAGHLRGDWAAQNRLFLDRIGPLDDLPCACHSP